MISNILIDSHILIWLLYEPERIGPDTRKLFQTAETVSISDVSLWELTIKHSVGKLLYSPHDLIAGVGSLHLNRLALTDEHLLEIQTIKLPHRDPFDRTLIAQSKTEGCTFLTADREILSSAYTVADVTK